MKLKKYQLILIILLLVTKVLYPMDYWQKTPIDKYYINGFAEDSKGRVYICGYDRYSSPNTNGMGIYRTSDNGSTWEYLGLSDIKSHIFSIFCDNDDTIYLGVHAIDSSLLVSTDYGVSWHVSRTGLMVNTGTYPDVDDFTSNSKNEIFGVSSFGIIKTTNKGNSWKMIYASGDGFNPSIKCDSKDNIIMASDMSMYLYNEDIDSTDAKQMLSCNGLCQFHDIAINSKDIIFATGKGTPVIYTIDRKNFYNLYMNNNLIGSGIIFCDKEDNLYVQTSTEDVITKNFFRAFFKSTDDGQAWTNINYNFPDTIKIRIVFISRNGYMYLGTYRNGVFRSTNPVVGITDENIDDDLTITPNPARDYVEVSLSNHTLKGVVEIVRVFDVLGICVITSPLDPLHSGEGSKVRLDVSHLPPGVYFLQIGTRMQRFVKM